MRYQQPEYTTDNQKIYPNLSSNNLLTCFLRNDVAMTENIKYSFATGVLVAKLVLLILFFNRRIIQASLIARYTGMIA